MLGQNEPDGSVARSCSRMLAGPLRFRDGEESGKRVAAAMSRDCPPQIEESTSGMISNDVFEVVRERGNARGRKRSRENQLRLRLVEGNTVLSGAYQVASSVIQT